MQLSFSIRVFELPYLLNVFAVQKRIVKMKSDRQHRNHVRSDDVKRVEKAISEISSQIEDCLTKMAEVVEIRLG